MRHRAGALFVVAVALMVSSAIALTAVSLLRTGDAVQMGVGIGMLVIVAIGLVLVAGEVRLAADSERLGRRLGEEGGLPEELPDRMPSGRLPAEAAERQFDTRKAEVEQAPEDWRAWFRLALAYADSKDSSAGRRAMRRAIALERSQREAPNR